MNWKHRFRVLQNPLFVQVWSVVICRSVMCGDIEKQMRVLRGAVLRSVRRRKTHRQHNGLPQRILFALSQESYRVVHYQIRIIVFVIIIAVLDLLPIHVDRVIVVFGVHNESSPFSPTRRYIRTIVFIQIFAKITSSVTSIREIRCEAARLVTCLPLGTAAIVVVGENLMIVDIHARQHGTSAWAAHGSRGVGVPELHAAVS